MTSNKNRFVRRALAVLLAPAVLIPAPSAPAQDPAEPPEMQELERRAAELDRMETRLETQAADLQTAEQKQSNIELRQAVLDARSALVKWRRAQQEYALNRKLADRGIVSAREVESAREAAENARLAHRDAVLALERTRLDILREAAVITVVGARVYRTESVRKSVDVTLANLSNLGRAAVAYYDDSEDALRTRLRVPDIRVSLRDDAIIAEPYVQTVDKLDLGEEATLTFELLQGDLESVTVDIVYFDKTVSERVFLRKDSEDDQPAVNALNFDQTGQLGETITYDLVLERLAETEKTYRLAVLNMPPELQSRFRDVEQEATVSAVKFAQDVTRKTLELQLIIPEEMAQEKLDEPVTFYVLALDEDAREALLALKRAQADAGVDAEDLRAAGIAHERLVFTPRGVGRCELLSTDLYKEITGSEPVSIRFAVRNTGSVPLRNIRMEVDLPADWEANVQPDVVRELALGAEQTVNIEVFPSPDLGVGDYSVRVDAEATHEGQAITIDDKVVRIHAESRANLLGGLILLAVLVAALVGIAVFLVRLARR